MKFSALLRNVLVTDVMLLTIGAIIAIWLLEPVHLLPITIAVMLTTLYTLLGVWYTHTYFDAPHDVFMSKVYGAVAVRLVLLAASIFVILKFTSLPQITFTVSIFISYIGKSIQEILFIHRKSAQT